MTMSFQEKTSMAFIKPFNYVPHQINLARSCLILAYLLISWQIFRFVGAESQCPSNVIGSRLSPNGFCLCSVTNDNYYLQCFRVNLIGLKTAIGAVDADKIASLIVRRSRLPTVPANLFKSMTSLKRLSIINSGLRTIPCNLFESKYDKDLPFSDALEVIDFSFNQLDSLCSYLFFGPLSNLNEDAKLKIDLHFSRLTSIPKGLFGAGASENHKVAEIDISWNPQLADLPEGVFSSMPHLKSLDLSHNKLLEFRKEWFTEPGGNGAVSSTSLQSLDLDNNQFRTIRAVDFQDFTQLQELDLSGNYITSVPEDALPSALVKLDLGSNRLRTLSAHLFEPLTELRELDLSDNPFQSLPISLFATNDNLKQLALRNYPQQFLSPQIFGSNSNLDLDTIDLTGASLRPAVQRALLGEANAKRGTLEINVDTSID